MSKLVELLEKQRDMELEHVKRLQPSVEKTGHRLASALLETILHDSMKHAALCQALLDLEAGAAPATLDMDMGTAVGLHQDIRAHVKVEERMITRLESIREGVEEPRIREIVGTWGSSRSTWSRPPRRRTPFLILQINSRA
jgi:hypothetical protein